MRIHTLTFEHHQIAASCDYPQALLQWCLWADPRRTADQLRAEIKRRAPARVTASLTDQASASSGRPTGRVSRPFPRNIRVRSTVFRHQPRMLVLQLVLDDRLDLLTDLAYSACVCVLQDMPMLNQESIWPVPHPLAVHGCHRGRHPFVLRCMTAHRRVRGYIDRRSVGIASARFLPA
jgi:hypothetical protein